MAVHALLAAAVVLYLDWAPGPEVSAELDLASVELSFAEKVDETRATAPSLPTPTEASPKPSEAKPPDAKPEKPMPPDPSAPKLREPEEEFRSPPPPLSSTSSSAAPRQAKVDAPPRPKRAIKPDYPKGARQRGEQGSVVLEIEVAADGSCAAARVVSSSGFAELDAAAVAAAKAARFSPAKSDGHPVASSARLTLAFKLK